MTVIELGVGAHRIQHVLHPINPVVPDGLCQAYAERHALPLDDVWEVIAHFLQKEREQLVTR